MLGQFMNGVMKWTTRSKITNMCLITLEYDESVINIKKTPKTLTQITMMGPPQSLLGPSTFTFVLPALIDEN